MLNIFERKQEARYPFFRVVELTDTTDDPAIWGRNFPFQYDDYLRTVDMVRTRFGGSEAMPRTPTQADPRSIVARSELETDPRLKIMWAGYPFAVDAREAGVSEAELADALNFQRKAQFYLDFIESENSMGFHAPQEAARILTNSIDFSRKGQATLRKSR